MSKNNGKSNGHDKTGDEKRNEDKIVHFPSLAERTKKIRAAARAAAEANTKPKPASVPFFNWSIIPPFTRILVISFLLIQIAMSLAPDDLAGGIIYMFGFVPGHFTGAVKPFPPAAALSPLTHIFLHGTRLPRRTDRSTAWSGSFRMSMSRRRFQSRRTRRRAGRRCLRGRCLNSANHYSKISAALSASNAASRCRRGNRRYGFATRCYRR